MDILLNNEKIKLCGERCLYFYSNKMIVISDAHFGKIHHFRKAGIGVPMQAGLKDFFVFTQVLNNYQPKVVLFLGDLFHSEYNYAVNQYRDVINLYPNIKQILVKGNHDILEESVYQDLEMMVVDQFKYANFIFSHDAVNQEIDHYNLHGHIHPGITVSGKARQTLSFPCFYFGKKVGIVPAFGAFTGFVSVSPQIEDQVYVILPDGKIKTVNQ